MSYKLINALLITASPVLCIGQVQVYRLAWTDDTHTVAQAQLVTSDTAPASGVEAYDNWRQPDWIDPGVSVHPATFRVGGGTFSDDLQMEESGIVTSNKWSFVNMSNGNTITSFRMSDTWYNSQGNTILAFNYQTIGYNVTPGV
ncbi:MAG: hypothetical protein KGS45_00030 [Planctomycetes bacterium]|nr:hypothetical protein [Planctomycetota bacterium]